MKENKTKEFTNFMKQDFDIVKDYKNASKELTPKEAFEIIEEVMTANMPPNYLSDELHTISKALTDYTKQTESLEKLREKYEEVVKTETEFINSNIVKTEEDLGEKIGSTINISKARVFIKDINTILEGGKV
jgi:hypothetical protein